MKFKLQALGAAAVMFAAAGVAQAAITYNANVTPDVIFGDGNANGAFTVDTVNGIELGLRGKLRHNASGAPENTFNSNGDGTYSFVAGVAPTQSSPTAVWSVEFSINTNTTGSTGLQLNDLTYALGIDHDASQGTSFTSFDVINLTYADHALGNNSTMQGPGNPNVAADATAYAAAINTLNVAQNSQKAHWLLGAGFDPTVDGTYDFYLAAFRGNDQVARTDIQIIVGKGGSAVVPEPASLALAGLALFGLAAARRRR